MTQAFKTSLKLSILIDKILIIHKKKHFLFFRLIFFANHARTIGWIEILPNVSPQIQKTGKMKKIPFWDGLNNALHVNY